MHDFLKNPLLYHTEPTPEACSAAIISDCLSGTVITATGANRLNIVAIGYLNCDYVAPDCECHIGSAYRACTNEDIGYL